MEQVAIKVNTNELKAARIRLGKSCKDMGAVISKSTEVYNRKENGFIRFDIDEIVAIAKDLGMDFDTYNLIFFASQLPNSNKSLCELPCGNIVAQK